MSMPTFSNTSYKKALERIMKETNKIEFSGADKMVKLLEEQYQLSNIEKDQLQRALDKEKSYKVDRKYINALKELLLFDKDKMDPK